jgi:hypothetical protein
MHEYSTVHEKQTFRWTKNSEAKITKERKLRKLAQDEKPIDVQGAEALLSGLNKSSVMLDGYIYYLSHFIALAAVMLDDYGNTLTEAEQPSRRCKYKPNNLKKHFLKTITSIFC